ncbi:iron sulfur assembly protein 1 [Myriangium duriaei CBS 260.36]|uniref:Iron-sulfur assembly protein 1 n=1 Tax=Myriangium duriaei CBS 260.36 TaxID=1168546 RepID=A0A9P4J258_9PEZI|nr:iron sulfur assembly protein 1 [Myriangium duriaei CBS 260.36]
MTAARSTSSALNTIFRFASPYLAPPARNCPRCFRPFSSSPFIRQSSKRQLQTATAYKPYALEPNFPPPRNAGVPETSIAGGLPKIDQSSKPAQKEVASSQGQGSQFPQASEKDAQKSSASNVITTPSTSPQPSTKPRRSKLRPRKAAMNLTPKAVEQLRALLDQPEPKLIRVGVKNRGCSGLAYHLEYVDKPAAFDEAVEQDGVKVLIDSKALFSIIGSEMDWVEDKLNQRFVFKNPNITEQCGCGESFSIS